MEGLAYFDALLADVERAMVYGGLNQNLVYELVYAEKVLAKMEGVDELRGKVMKLLELVDWKAVPSGGADYKELACLKYDKWYHAGAREPKGTLRNAVVGYFLIRFLLVSVIYLVIASGVIWKYFAVVPHPSTEAEIEQFMTLYQVQTLNIILLQVVLGSVATYIGIQSCLRALYCFVPVFQDWMFRENFLLSFIDPDYMDSYLCEYNYDRLAQAQEQLYQLYAGSKEVAGLSFKEKDDYVELVDIELEYQVMKRDGLGYRVKEA